MDSICFAGPHGRAPLVGVGARARVVTLMLGLLSLFWVSAEPAMARAPVANPHGRNEGQSSGFGPLDPAAPTGFTAEQIIAKFAARETVFAKALEDYTFRRTTKVQTISDDTGKPDGEYQDTTDIAFTDAGAHTEHVVFAPANTLTRVMMSQADFDDIEHRLPFILTTADLPEYDVTYLGRQRVDELDTYVFQASPKHMEKNHRYFQGKIWVDQKDLQIVLVDGKNVPDDVRPGHEDLSPPFATYYSEVDGYWFPVYTHADGVLHFPAQRGALRQDVQIRYTVKYTDYKRFRAKSRIIYNGETLAGADGTKAPDAAPAAAPDPSTNPATLPPSDPNAPTLSHPKPQ